MRKAKRKHEFDESESLFHQTFLNILMGKDKLEIRYNEIKEFVDFKFNFDILPKTCDTVEKIAPYLLQSVKKEQQLIESNVDYYIARDLIDNTVYICFKELMIIDIDEKNIDEIISHFNKHHINESFRVYNRMNDCGVSSFHIFLTSRKVEYRNNESVSFMLSNFCDFYYAIFSYIRGFCVRLNNKFLSSNKYEYMCTINEYNEDPELVKLVELHETLLEKYSKLDCCYPKNAR